MEQQLNRANVRFERWPAVRGGPELLRTHAQYFKRGIQSHLYVNRTNASGTISSWGTIGTYVAHHTLFESIVKRWAHNDSATFLILQDDTQLYHDWLERLGSELRRVDPKWARLLLVWWGQARRQDCKGHFCLVRPPAGPTEPGSPECCGKRFYHGLQAWIVRRHNLRCLLRRLKRRRIKNIDAQMVQCGCPGTYALTKRRMLGKHLDKELGSERAAVNSMWKNKIGETPTLKKSAKRNMKKVGLFQHLYEQPAG